MLVALGVIFIPMILSGGRDEMPIFGSNIPDKPRAIEKLKSLEIPVPPPLVARDEEIRIPVDKRLPPGKDEPHQKRQQGKPESGKPGRPEKQADFIQKPSTGKAWVVQVGSFSKRANALALEKKLRKNKFPAFVELIKNKQGSVYRVRVGPELKRNKAEAQMQAIRKKMKINAVVMRHP